MRLFGVSCLWYACTSLQQLDRGTDFGAGPSPTPQTASAMSLELDRPALLHMGLQVPGGNQNYSLTMHWALPHPPVPGSLLARFVEGDEMFRGPRLKLIPRIHKVGSRGQCCIKFEDKVQCLVLSHCQRALLLSQFVHIASEALAQCGGSCKAQTKCPQGILSECRAHGW